MDRRCGHQVQIAAVAGIGRWSSTVQFSMVRPVFSMTEPDAR
jgi:hypothetical protein